MRKTMSDFDLNKLLEQAKKVQSNMSKTTENLESMKIEGQSGAGLIKVVCNGRHDVLSVNIDPEALQLEKQVLEELIAAAVNDAMRRIEKQTKASMLDLVKGIDLGSADASTPTTDQTDKDKNE